MEINRKQRLLDNFIHSSTLMHYIVSYELACSEFTTFSVYEMRGETTNGKNKYQYCGEQKSSAIPVGITTNNYTFMFHHKNAIKRTSHR